MGITESISEQVRLYNHNDIKIGCCPFHKETAPSLIVYPAEDRFVCLSCGASGNAEEFMQILHKKERSAAACAEVKGNERLYDVLRSASGYFSWRLGSDRGKEGLEYFKNRGLTDETMKAFSLGVSGGFGDRLIQNLKKWGYTDEEILNAGLSFQKEGDKPTDRFYDRVMFPIKDEEGRIIGFTGRALSPEAEKKMKYCNTPETDLFRKRETVYGLDLAKQSPKDYFILVEGNMDVISMHQYGFGNAVASCGTSLTREQCRKLKAYKNRVMVMYDSDDPGVTSAIRAIRLLRDEGLDVVVTDVFPYKDPDELLKKAGAEQMRKQIRSAMHATKYIAKMAEPEEALNELLQTDVSDLERFL